MEKYKELYDLSKEVLNEERDRFNRMDEKASKYLTVLTLLIGVYGFLCDWVVKTLLPPKTKLDWSLLMVGGLLFIAVSTSWTFIFWALRQQVVIKIPLNDEVIKFFKDHRPVDIYYALAQGNKEALRDNREVTERKARMLNYGYITIAVTMCLVFIFSLLFGAYCWNHPSIDIINKKGVAMLIDKEKNNEEEPNPDIRPPKYDRLTEGVDPKSAIKKDKEK